MSIASEITRINNNIASAYTACDNKGATMPATQNSANLATCIGSIQTGGGGSTLITKSITQNGTYNASSDNADGYSSVTVNVSGGNTTEILREVVNGEYKAPETSFTFSLPSNATRIGARGMVDAFHNSTGLTSADLSSLTSVATYEAMRCAFYGCTSLTSVDLGSLTTVSGFQSMLDAFYGCTSLTSVDLGSLTTVSGSSDQPMISAFKGCTSLTEIDLSSLTTISARRGMETAFYGCTSLTDVDLSSLDTLIAIDAMYQTFYGCTSLTSVDLSALICARFRCMYGTFAGCTNLTSIDLSGLVEIGFDTDISYDNSQFSECFKDCNNLTSITFTNLEKIYCTGDSTGSKGTFSNNNKIQKMYFPKLNTITYGSGASSSNQDACKNIFYGCTDLTELHFGAANQSAIEATPGYSTAWGRGASNVTIYFDL